MVNKAERVDLETLPLCIMRVNTLNLRLTAAEASQRIVSKLVRRMILPPDDEDAIWVLFDPKDERRVRTHITDKLMRFAQD